MKFMAVLSNIDIDAEFTMFLCSVIAFFVLKIVRNGWQNQNPKVGKLVELKAKQTTSCDVPSYDDDDTSRAQTDGAFQAAFEKEDYWQVLQCWRELKCFPQSSIHLPMVIMAMRSCKKGAYFVVGELKSFFQEHPSMCTIGVINDLLDPLTRRSDDAQLVDLFVRLLPTLKMVKDARTYEILLTMHASNRNLAKAQEIVAEMQANKIDFSPCATASVLTMGLQMGSIDVVLKSFNKLKESWDLRTTWAVSMFAVESHKASVLTQIVELAFQKQSIAALAPALAGMTLPGNVLDALPAKIALMDDSEVAATIALLKDSADDLTEDAIYNSLVRVAQARTKTSAPWHARKRTDDADASTSEGSRSDSEGCCSPLPGVAAPPGF